MQIKISVFLCLFLLAGSVLAETLTIGCATKCDVFFRYALKKVSKLNNVTVKLVDVSADGPVIDWKKYDGIIFPGGADIDPSYYLPAIEPELQEYTRSLDHLVNYSEEGKRRDPIEYNISQNQNLVIFLFWEFAGACRCSRFPREFLSTLISRLNSASATADICMTVYRWNRGRV